MGASHPKKPRMNLFKEFTPKKKVRTTSPKTIMGVVIVCLIVVFSLKTFSSNRRQLSALKSQIQNLETELSMLRTESVRAPSSEPVVKKTHTGWSSVLWTLSISTNSRIVLKEMNLEPQGSNPQKVSLSGRATNLSAVRAWVEKLIALMPGTEFSLNQQHTVEDVEYPVEFLLTAQVF